MHNEVGQLGPACGHWLRVVADHELEHLGVIDDERVGIVVLVLVVAAGLRDGIARDSVDAHTAGVLVGAEGSNDTRTRSPHVRRGVLFECDMLNVQGNSANAAAKANQHALQRAALNAGPSQPRSEHGGSDSTFFRRPKIRHVIRHAIRACLVRPNCTLCARTCCRLVSSSRPRVGRSCRAVPRADAYSACTSVRSQSAVVRATWSCCSASEIVRSPSALGNFCGP
eukprot:scaffold19547_cov66-Phaeocystis_antarctica.AAC.5